MKGFAGDAACALGRDLQAAKWDEVTTFDAQTIFRGIYTLQSVAERVELLMIDV